MAYEIIITSKAGLDLDEIEQFVSRDDPAAAARLCRELLAEIHSLREFPHRGSILRHRRLGLRKLVYGSYFIIYQIADGERRIDILRFWHAAQDQERLRLRESAPFYSAVS